MIHTLCNGVCDDCGRGPCYIPPVLARTHIDGVKFCEHFTGPAKQPRWHEDFSLKGVPFTGCRSQSKSYLHTWSPRAPASGIPLLL